MATGTPDWKQSAPQKTYVQLLREGNAFSGIITIGGSAGFYSHVQLWNPGNSGVGVLLHMLTANSAANGMIYLYEKGSFTTNLSTDVTNRYIGGRASTVELRYGWSPGVFAGKLGNFYVEADIPRISPELYIWIPPNKDVIAIIDQVNTELRAHLTWFEFTDY